MIQIALDYIRPAGWEYLPNGWRNLSKKIKGWNVSSIAETQRRKWPSYINLLNEPLPLGINHEATTMNGEDILAHNLIMSYAYVLALAARGRKKISLLDWGGGMGHYYPLSRKLLPEVEIAYYCQEVPLLCQAGREVLPQAVFYEKPDQCFNQTYDLVLASSSLWYEEGWREKEAKLAAAAQEYLYITRMVFVERAESFAAVQRPWSAGYKTEYVCWILNRDDFIHQATGQGLVLVREFLLGNGPRIHRAPEQGKLRGFLFRRPVR